VLTHLPNALTLLRILLILPIAALMLVDLGLGGRIAAFVLFLIAAVSDALDGWVARRWDKGSLLGQVLDPVADKLLVAAVLILLVADGTLDGWHSVAVAVMVLRDLLISGLRESLAALGQVGALPVSRLGKAKTLLQLIAIGFLLGPVQGWPQTVGVVIVWLAAALSLWSAAAYAFAAWGLLKPPRN